MNQIYKVCEVIDKGKTCGAILSDEPNTEWLHTPTLMAKTSKDHIELFYGHKRYYDAYEPLKIDKTEVSQVLELIRLWKSRKMGFAKWDGYGAIYRGQIGWKYSKPNSNKEEDFKVGDIKMKRNKLKKTEKIKGYQKVSEEYTNGELSTEIFDWNGKVVTFERSEIGIRQGRQGVIIPYYEINTLMQLLASACKL